MKNVLKPLAKSILIPLGFTAAASATDATDAVIHQKIFGSCTRTFTISNEEMLGKFFLYSRHLHITTITRYNHNCNHNQTYNHQVRINYHTWEIK